MLWHTTYIYVVHDITSYDGIPKVWPGGHTVEFYDANYKFNMKNHIISQVYDFYGLVF